MTPMQLDLDADLVARLTPVQEGLLDELQASLERLEPRRLDLDRCRVALDQGVLHVELPHVDDRAQDLGAAVGDDAAIVSYGDERKDLRADGPARGAAWPFPAPDHGVAAARLLEQLLAGRVEVLVRPGLLQERRLTAWIDDAGTHQPLFRSGSLRWQRHPDEASVRRFDFGARGEGRR